MEYWSYHAYVFLQAVFELRIEQQGEPSLVPPAEETPSGLYYLSNLDQNIAVIVQTVYCFRATDGGGDGISACERRASPGCTARPP